MIELADPVATRTEVRESSGRVLSAQYIDVDVDAQLVFRDGKPLARLPHKEFELLRFLLEHAGRVVTREEITRHVWGVVLEPRCDSTLDVHMRRLRGRIEHDPRRPELVRTLRGIGYIFDTAPVPGAAPRGADAVRYALEPPP